MYQFIWDEELQVLCPQIIQGNYLSVKWAKEMIEDLQSYVAIGQAKIDRKNLALEIDYADDWLSGRTEKPGFVYVMESDGLYKIGNSTNPQQRIKQILGQGTKPQVVVSVRVPDCVRMERYLHMKYGRQHIQGEWFSLKKSHVEHIGKLLELYSEEL